MKLSNQINNIVYSANGKYIAASSIDMTFNIYDIANDKFQKVRPSMESVCLNIQFNTNASYIAATSSNGSIYIYSVKNIMDGELNCLIKEFQISSDIRLNTSQILLFHWYNDLLIVF